MRPTRLLLFAAGLLAAATAGAQLPGQKVLTSPTDARRDALLSPANPGVAPPLDIRIQDEGLALPRGVGDDAPPPAPAAPTAAPAPKPAPEPRKP